MTVLASQCECVKEEMVLRRAELDLELVYDYVSGELHILNIMEGHDPLCL